MKTQQTFLKRHKKLGLPKSKEFPMFPSAYQVKVFIDKLTTSLHAGQSTHFNKTEFLQ